VIPGDEEDLQRRPRDHSSLRPVRALPKVISSA
jgi:hypothetical protein